MKSFNICLAALAALTTTPCLALSPKDNVAGAQAYEAFIAQRQTCGQKVVMAVDVSPPQANGFTSVPGHKPLKPYTIYNEATGIDRRLEGPGDNVSAADRMNGIQWKGRVVIAASAAREISVNRDGTGSGSWSAWKSNVTLAIVDVQQSGGRWSVSVTEPDGVRGLGRFAQLRRASCSEVPS
jgi:hypothetical protein